VFALVAFLTDQIWEHGVQTITVLVMLAVLAVGLERLVPVLRRRGKPCPTRW
jgi:hypothetical protein